jgi:hypothetical protein
MASAAQEGEDENYWPGFVDALTTMVMVLTFIMMILGLTVFSLSQNVSHQLLSEIAKAAKIETQQSDFPDAIVSRIVAAIDAQNQAIDQRMMQAPVPTPAPVKDKPASAAPRAQGPEALPLQAEVHQSTAPAHLKPLAEGAAAGAHDLALTIVYQHNATLYDEAVQREIIQFAAHKRDAHLLIRAYAVETGGTISEARRLAYYRAMMLRQELVKAGLKPSQLAVQIDDHVDPAQRSLVRIFVTKKNP